MSESIVLGGRAQEVVQCHQCQKSLTIGERHAYKGKDEADVYFCDSCLFTVNQQLDDETKNPNLLVALLLGLLAGLAGGAVWFVITCVTQWTIGYVAIGLGWLVGQGIIKGAGGKKGPILQIMAAAITLVSIVITEIFVVCHFIVEALHKEGSTTANAFDMLLLGIQNEGFISFFSNIFPEILSPIGLLIWGFGIWTAYNVPKVHKL